MTKSTSARGLRFPRSLVMIVVVLIDCRLKPKGRSNTTEGQGRQKLRAETGWTKQHDCMYVRFVGWLHERMFIVIILGVLCNPSDRRAGMW
jgi:hypothetical protein